MKSYDVVGWTGDAEILCERCGFGAYGVTETSDVTVYDGDGNPVRPVFADQAYDYEADAPYTCGSCGEALI